MPFSVRKILPSAQSQLNILGGVTLALAAFAAWSLLQPLTWTSAVPLVFVGYAFLRIAYELTLNRENVPTLATTFAGRRKIANFLREDASARGKDPYRVIDLGSGRGELTRVIAKRIPQAKVVGIEFARIPCAQAALVQRWLGPKNLSYECRDFWPFDCSDIDAAVFYLNPSMARRVGEKLHRELKPGSVVISHTFPLGDEWTPLKIMDYRSPFKERAYIYRKD
ncbi:MAG: class I SAM-dependent methyltransferase [Alphaproteobacteria bacterium]|nr:class I SAM-dependent methyltransferase [Alphaproteobacteria bacterium]